MTEPFVGRRAELELLRRQHAAPEGAFVPIYGRRRVGKSELILELLKSAPGVYYVGKTAPAALQLRELLREAARVVGEPLLAELATEDWKLALGAIVERWKGPGKLVLALDEFQWMVKQSPELVGVLQELWDRSWRRSGRVMLVLCGSYVGFMEREVLGQKSPLFGRRTAQILLRPFSFAEAAEFHPRWSLIDRARAYFVCGGIPLYLRFFDPARSVESNIEQNLFDELAPLFREPDFLLREELREVESYYAALLAIAQGHDTGRLIAERAGLPERSLPYYIHHLAELGYLGRRVPLTGGRPILRRVRYDIADPLLRFWFRFVFPNLTAAVRFGPRRTFRERVRPELDAYFGLCFERLCREALPGIYEREGVSANCEIGEYWDKALQLDLVSVRDDGQIDLGECRWGSVRSVPALAAELAAKAERFPNPKNATLGRLAFVRKKSKPAPADGTRLYDLEDLYGVTR